MYRRKEKRQMDSVFTWLFCCSAHSPHWFTYPIAPNLPCPALQYGWWESDPHSGYSSYSYPSILARSLSTTTGLSNYFHKTTFYTHERLRINGDSMAIALGTSISHFPHVYLCLLLSHQKLPSSALIPTLRLLPREMFTLLGCSASQLVASTFSRLC
jgi:hypothetical protein